MAVSKAEKETELQELEGIFRTADTAVLVDYRGVSVPQVTELRRQVRAAGASYRVVKNTIAKRAAAGTSIASLDKHYKIENAINNPGRQFTLNQCYGIDASYCKDISRRPVALGAQSAGSLAIINQAPANTGGQLTRGIDLTANHSMKLAGGDLNTALSYTYQIKSYEKATPIADLDYSQDEPGSSRNRWVLNLGFDKNGFGVKTTATYITHVCSRRPNSLGTKPQRERWACRRPAGSNGCRCWTDRSSAGCFPGGSPTSCGSDRI